MDLKSPKELEILGNLSENWKRFKQRFEIYLEASGLNEKKDNTKTAIFLNIAGENAIDIYNNFKFDKEEDKYNPDIILKQFEDYCDPLKNTTNRRSQEKEPLIPHPVEDLPWKKVGIDLFEL
ncbi:hypothetical protein LAZ67_5002987 [Cordylochernes scorpioides]|uniref:Cathepsin propeptide inhibitor domain-containing protein n=1 Tax=Cordylochernes scorpioides TaxID=51811 RepID=A0ABY6KHY2_9ARAC|nr:hypothetical protein LAZ67_5002987 [Cordylochernes scorpioides]